jgi:4-hydroxyacetophenone monooxygenase
MSASAQPDLQRAADELSQEAAEALQFADPMALRGLLYLLSGDESLRLIRTEPQPGMFAGEMAAIADPADVAVLQQKTVELLLAHRAGTVESSFSRERILAAIELAVGAEVPEADADFWIEELALDPQLRGLTWEREPEPDRLAGLNVVVIGAGLAGVNAAIRLKQAGVPFTVVEKNAGVGGTWFQNTYPGARVDVPSRVYSHTFGVAYPWTHLFAPQKENEQYINWCVDEFDVRSDIRLNIEVTSARWDQVNNVWSIHTRSDDGTEEVLQARAIISAVGFMDRPKVPAIDGLDSFRGPVFHTARWDSDYELEGKRVAVIGTGASACQLVPDLAPLVGSLTVFQRSAPWFLGLPGYRDPLPAQMTWLDRHVPLYTNWFRLRTAWAVADRVFRPLIYTDPDWDDPISISAGNHAVLEHLTAYIREQVGDDQALLEKCLPQYPPFAKRFVVDNGWFEALRRDEIELVTDPIARVTPDGIVTESGTEIACDVIILATGFHSNDYLWPMEITGTDGVTIAERWATDGARAYNGVMVPGFPNFFMLYGPNTNAFANGPVVWGELQTRYALEWLQIMATRDIDVVDVKQTAYDEFNARMDERLSSAVWLDPRQKSYYTNEFGRVATNAPWSTEEYWHFTRRPNLQHFDLG